MSKYIMRFSDWSSFKEKFLVVKDKPFSSEKELCELMEMDYDLYSKIINGGVLGWIESPSKSFFNAISKTKLNIPSEGVKIFKNYLDQTRFAHLLNNYSIIREVMFSRIKNGNGNKVKVKNESALTYPDKSSSYFEQMESKVNNVLQLLFLYAFYTHVQIKKQNIKIPKKLYRGVRLSNIYSLPSVKKVIDPLKRQEGEDWRKFHARRLDAVINLIQEKGLQTISENRDIISFTSSKSVAKYFAKDGLILEIDSADIDVFTSYLQDERFDFKDNYSKKEEKEVIIRVPRSKVTVTNIIINDLDYFVANQHPLSAPLIDHHDKVASYELDGIKIEVYGCWQSNTKFVHRYRNMDDKYQWGLSSREFKSSFGINPTITEKNYSKVKDFAIKEKS